MAAPAAGARVSRFEGLDSDDFRHPLDQQNTRLLRALPGLEALAKNLMGPVAESVLLLENIGEIEALSPNAVPSCPTVHIMSSIFTSLLKA